MADIAPGATDDDPPERPPEPPPPPFPPEEVRDLIDGEVLRLGFHGPEARRSLSLDLGSSSLSALNGLVSVMTADKFGNLGDRGPVATPAHVEPLAIVDALFTSAVFYFAPGAPEELVLPVAGSPIVDVVDEVIRLVEVSRNDAVVAVAKEHHPRVAARYVDFLDVVSNAQVETHWRGDERTAALSRDDALRALEVLERTDVLSTRPIAVIGTLYEANARSRGFRLERDEDGMIIVGRFAEDLIQTVGALWNQTVIAQIDVTTERLVRTGKERLRFTLTGLEGRSTDRVE